MSNRIVWILICFGICFVLYSKNKPKLIGRTWTTIFGQESTKTGKNNPYKNPEPTEQVDVAHASNTSSKKSSEAPQQEETSLLERVKQVILPQQEEQDERKNEELTLPNWVLPASTTSKGQIVKHKNYILNYIEEYEVSSWVAYQLKDTYVKGKASRDMLPFIPDRGVKTKSALSQDYNGSGYDRGHLVPAGDFKCCQDLLSETFYMSNIAPQVPDFNRGIWQNLEERVRGWARRDESIYIVVGPVLKKNLPTIGYNKVAVPEQFYKIVLFNEEGKTPRMIGFLFPNQALFGERLTKFVVPVDEIEQITGIDFFTSMPDKLENSLESTSDWSAWTKVQ